jgi:hypothetical protein
MTINVFGGGDSSGPAFPVQRSVRLRSSASAYFNRTLTTPTNNLKWTWSSWLKRGTFATNQLFSIGTSGTGADQAGIQFYLDSMSFYQTQTSTGTMEFIKTTTQVFRDPSAWYHIVIAYDSTDATAGNRIKIYVNGIQVTSFSTSTDPTLNLASRINSARVHDIGRYGSGINYTDGYLTEVNFVDGQALTPASFGSYNSNGVWQNIKYSGTYGTNGFYLNFQDNSAATAAAIGKDSSGNGNNWTPNNISVTAGVTYDSMTDVPTLTSATNANFAVINPVNQSGQTITNGNLTTQWSLTAAGQRSTFALDSGQWYWEVTMTSIGNQTSTGIVRTDSSLTADFAVAGSNAVSYLALNGNKILNGTSTSYGATFATGDVIGVAVDITNNTATFYKNGTSQGQITGLSLSGFSWYVASCNSNNQASQIANYNFGQRPFTYTPPTGFKSLNTFNLPDSTIPSGATQFAATTYTGVGSSLAISNTVNGKSFQPDFVWVKGRSGATDHALYDSVRGTTKQLESNATAAETTEATGLTAFDSTGFTVGALAQMNTNTATYVGWQWKAGGTAVTNTSGSISSQVSANPSAGFSIVTYTGTGVAATVGHGLNVAPRMIIVKTRTGTAREWVVGHSSLSGGWNDFILLSNTAAKQTGITTWNNTAPTSSVFSLGTGAGVNESTILHVAYCFSEIAGYSKFGSYTGNGAADGVFVYTGFRPRYILYKNSAIASSWVIWDTTRSTYNVMGQYLIAESSIAEGTAVIIDMLSNGFKLRTTDAASNGNTNNIIYMAFAENPFKNSLAR